MRRLAPILELVSFIVEEKQAEDRLMGKSSSGPDWTDVEMMMRALEGLHTGHVALVVSPDGTGATGGLDVAASFLFNVLPGSSLPENVIVHKKWPCNTHSQLAAHAFATLHELDYAISKVYRNEALWSN